MLGRLERSVFTTMRNAEMSQIAQSQPYSFSCPQTTTGKRKDHKLSSRPRLNKMCRRDLGQIAWTTAPIYHSTNIKLATARNKDSRQRVGVLA